MRAFLVLGPESSGTRLMTRLLIAADCYGDDGHEQRLDRQVPDPEKEPLIVWRRSWPHDGRLPDTRSLVKQLKDYGYPVTQIVMSRDWHAMAGSQVTAPHVDDCEGAYNHIRMAYLMIARSLDMGFYEVVNYEAIISRPQEFMAAFYQRHGLTMPDTLPEIFDANEKYYAP